MDWLLLPAAEANDENCVPDISQFVFDINGCMSNISQSVSNNDRCVSNFSLAFSNNFPLCGSTRKLIHSRGWFPCKKSHSRLREWL
ncbi:hypothetical protein [Bacillus salacetis]|uniref:hypothetical protein n=1 Tax=Bacillus salacetis TaxID=2315464 RepID=UPI0014447B7A|nr:hypothetical protein [Bacillus salacetis]